jgi:hypothetical protein
MARRRLFLSRLGDKEGCRPRDVRCWPMVGLFSVDADGSGEWALDSMFSKSVVWNDRLGQV